MSMHVCRLTPVCMNVCMYVYVGGLGWPLDHQELNGLMEATLMMMTEAQEEEMMTSSSWDKAIMAQSLARIVTLERMPQLIR